jgi:nucleoside-diphosphate-sugar epimerase
LKSLSITGVPGWLTESLLCSLEDSLVDGLAEVRALVQPELLPGASQLRNRHPIISAIHGFDLAHPGDSDVAQALEGVDVLLHAAGVIHVHRTNEWYRVNTAGTVALARAALDVGVRRFLFISSNAAGGACGTETQVLTETDPARPRSHYGCSKWLAEKELLKMHKPGEFEVVILRPSMFYGPPVPERHIEVYRRILAGRMPMVGDGQYRRSITYIDNLVQATRLALTHPAAGGEVFYVVDDPIYTTRGITEAMAAALGVPLKTISLPAVAGPVAYWTDRLLASVGFYWQNLHLMGESHWHVAISCNNIKRRLGYIPTVELREGMRRSVEWCRQNRKL